MCVYLRLHVCCNVCVPSFPEGDGRDRRERDEDRGSKRTKGDEENESKRKEREMLVTARDGERQGETASERGTGAEGQDSSNKGSLTRSPVSSRRPYHLFYRSSDVLSIKRISYKVFPFHSVPRKPSSQ